VGAIYFSIDVGLVRVLKDCLALTTFVETGTFHGDSVDTVRDLFPRIYTVENSPELAEAARRRFDGFANVEVVCEDSPTFLRRLSRRFQSEPTLFWLDAHWCGPMGAGHSGLECPLLEELAAIGSLPDQNVILIDDARLFLSPPPPPHDHSRWPALQEILSALAALSAQHRVMVLNDTILLYPPRAAAAVADYARHHGFDLLQAINQLRSSGISDLHEQLVAKEAVIRQLAAEVRYLREKKQVPDPAGRSGA
jgi:hypothetical protein